MAHIVHLYKGKGDKYICKGISFLSIADDVLAKDTADKIQYQPPWLCAPTESVWVSKE